MALPSEAVILICVASGAVVVCALLFLAFRRRHQRLPEDEQTPDAERRSSDRQTVEMDVRPGPTTSGSSSSSGGSRPPAPPARGASPQRHLPPRHAGAAVGHPAGDRGEECPATPCSLMTARGSQASPRLHSQPRADGAGAASPPPPPEEWWHGGVISSPSSIACRVDGPSGALPCNDDVYHDFRPGGKSCGICGSDPIYNRQCRRCSMRMCERCFAWQRVQPAAAQPAVQATTRPDAGGPAAPPAAAAAGAGRRGVALYGHSPLRDNSPPANAHDEFPMPGDIALGPGVCIRPKRGEWGAYRLCKDFQWLRPAPGQTMSEDVAKYLAENLDALRKGLSCTYFSFLRGDCSKQADLDVAERILSLSSFEDECAPPPRGISLPPIDVTNVQQRSTWTFVINKSQYCIGPSASWTLDDIDEQMIASHYYAKCCMPPGTDVVIVKDERSAGLCWFPNQFRIKKPIIPYVYKFQLQMRVTRLSEQLCRELAPQMCDGLRIDRGFLLERTKRDPRKTDAIAKVKSLLLYHRLSGGGMVITMPTAAVAWSLPQWLRSVLNSLTHLNCKDVSATTQSARIFYATKCYKNCGVQPPEGYVPNTQQEL